MNPRGIVLGLLLAAFSSFGAAEAQEAPSDVRPMIARKLLKCGSDPIRKLEKPVLRYQGAEFSHAPGPAALPCKLGQGRVKSTAA
jgi:hypothetical protein